MLIFDIETDGLLYNVSTIHCIGIYDTETEETYVYNDTGSKEPIVKGVQMLDDAELICGHNIIGYDLPVLNKLYDFKFTGKITDTLMMSRLVYPNRRERDHLYRKPELDSR